MITTNPLPLYTFHRFKVTSVHGGDHFISGQFFTTTPEEALELCKLTWKPGLWNVELVESSMEHHPTPPPVYVAEQINLL